MGGAVHNVPAFVSLSPSKNAGKVAGSMPAYQTIFGPESPHPMEEESQRRRRAALNELRKETDSYCRFYQAKCKEVKADPTIIDTYFSNREVAISGTEEFIKVTKACISSYRSLGRVGGVEVEDVESIISSLRSLVAICEEFLWHVGVYDALQEPRTGKVCKSADEFIQELGF